MALGSVDTPYGGDDMPGLGVSLKDRKSLGAPMFKPPPFIADPPMLFEFRNDMTVIRENASQGHGVGYRGVYSFDVPCQPNGRLSSCLRRG